MCIENCGDGKDYGFLECDDGAKLPADGCTPTCTIEDGWGCDGGNPTFPDTCVRINLEN